MRKQECSREDELLDALQTSRWPEACDAALRESRGRVRVMHGPRWPSPRHCSTSIARWSHKATVPSSAIVWWRAQMRSRREAADKAASADLGRRSGIAVACAAGLLATALGIFVPTVRKAVAVDGGALHGATDAVIGGRQRSTR